MAGKVERQKSNSVAAITQASQARDRTADVAPYIPGAEVLCAKGREVLDRLYRIDPDRWTEADLLMLVEAASVQTQLAANRMLVVMTPLVIAHPNGSTGMSPTHKAQLELSRQLQNLLRDLGIRSKDGEPGAKAKPSPRTTPGQQATPAPDLDAWLGQMQ